MNEFPGVDPRPQWLINHQIEGTKPSIVSVDGVHYPYTLIKPGAFHPHLPYIVGFEHQSELFISANVPPEDRRPILTHEVREKLNFPLVPEGERCRAALAAELDEIRLARRDHDFRVYVKRRKTYFDALLQFYQKPQHAANVSKEYIDGLLIAAGYINYVTNNLRRKR